MDGELVDEEYIKRHGGYVYNDGQDNPPNIPDAKTLLSSVLELMEYMSSDELLKIKEINKAKYEEIVEAKFPEFVDTYYFVYKMLVDATPNTDISPLFKMISEIDKINKGKSSVEQSEKRLGNFLADKYIPNNIRKK